MPRLTDALARVQDAERDAPVSDSGRLASLETRDEPSLLDTRDSPDVSPNAHRPSFTRVQTSPLESPVMQPLRQRLTGLVERTFLVPARPGEAVRSLLFASVDGVEGSALVPAAVSEILLSRVRGWICLVDANFRSPSLHRHYGSTNALGLADALVGTSRASSYARELARGRDSSLWLMPTGDFSDAGAHLLEADAYRRRMRDVITAFEYLVIGTTIATANPSASILAAQVDGVILVAEANVTTRQSLRVAAQAVSASGGRVLGTVLNNRTFPIPEAIYRLL
ncbi:MAG: hypothetical protein GEV06_11440 [Luteitalea sp.]|nr:hypothetical protein [Luteitalea sp.]